jgi:hypothetical protein
MIQLLLQGSSAGRYGRHDTQRHFLQRKRKTGTLCGRPQAFSNLVIILPITLKPHLMISVYVYLCKVNLHSCCTNLEKTWLHLLMFQWSYAPKVD